MSINLSAGIYGDKFNLDSPLDFKGAIAVAADFPTSAAVQTGWFYKITANVTDNDATKTNTGQSFLAGDEIAWDGSAWISLGSTALWTDDGSTVELANTRDVSLNSDLAVDGNLSGLTKINTQAGTSYSLALTDKSALVNMTSASANTVTIEANATTAYGVGFTTIIRQGGAGVTTIQAAAGVSINGSVAGSYAIPNQYAVVSVMQESADSWLISVLTDPTFDSLTLNNALTVANGGTGASTAADARTNLGASAKTKTVNSQTGTTYTLALTDADNPVTMDNASANTVTIPTNASIAFPTGTILTVIQKGAGATTITGDTGVTVNGVSAGSTTFSAQYEAAALVKIDTDSWIIASKTVA